MTLDELAKRYEAQAETARYNGDDETAADHAATAAVIREAMVALKDVCDALEPHVDTACKIRKPYEHPLSAYDRARALVNERERDD